MAENTSKTVAELEAEIKRLKETYERPAAPPTAEELLTKLVWKVRGGTVTSDLPLIRQFLETLKEEIHTHHKHHSENA